MIESFKVLRRNPGHWDIIDEGGRAFAIRGGPGAYYVRDEREKMKWTIPTFKTLTSCMAFVCDELMHELIIAEGQTPTTIARWNIE
ncbi:MAG: hypothetical protein MUP86_02925 [Dehalococcoidia bacterium]|nr:hypothetical protein [Dehalococcoidia bacterium]